MTLDPSIDQEPGVMYPWCVCFVLSHLCLVGVLVFWDAMRSQSMLPASSMASASHLMVEETWILLVFYEQTCVFFPQPLVISSTDIDMIGVVT